jgi:long-subunit fatty acid transport protein
MMQLIFCLALVSDINPGAGTTGFSFIKVSPTAREAAMGSAALTLSDNAFGFWYNPSGIAGLKNRQLGVAYISYVAGIQSGAISYAQPGKTLTWGAGGYYLNSGLMPRTDEFGTEYGTFGASYLDLNGALAFKPLDKLQVGAGLKVIYGGIDTFWTIGAAADLGATYDLPLAGLRASLVARNLGVTARPFIDQNENLPVDLALGVGWQPLSGVLLDLEAHQPLDNNLEIRLGGEAWLHKYVCLRLGLTSAGSDLKEHGGADVLAGLSAGLGVRFRQFELDYSFTPMVILDNSHRVSFRYSFI